MKVRTIQEHREDIERLVDNADTRGNSRDPLTFSEVTKSEARKIVSEMPSTVDAEQALWLLTCQALESGLAREKFEQLSEELEVELRRLELQA